MPHLNALAEDHHLVTTGAPLAREHVVAKAAKKRATKTPRILCICVVSPATGSGVPRCPRTSSSG